MYSVHYPNQNYDSVLGILSLTKTNSSKTSSLPLADFWRPDRIKSKEMEELCKAINIKVDELKSQKTEFCFEYPTPAYDDKEPGKTLEHSKPSMTDLMILLKDTEETRITIEAKYTEYGKKGKEKEYAPLLKNWYDKPHKEKILQCWINYINKYFDNNDDHIPDAEVLIKKNPDLPYQFLHRTASACFNCEHPILVYQLFYDKKNFKAMEKFRNHLNEWAGMLKLDKEKLPFFIIETEVKLYSPALEKRIKNPSDLFTLMKDKAQYEFGKVNVLNGYDLKQVTPKH